MESQATGVSVKAKELSLKLEVINQKLAGATEKQTPGLIAEYQATTKAHMESLGEPEIDEDIQKQIKNKEKALNISSRPETIERLTADLEQLKGKLPKESTMVKVG